MIQIKGSHCEQRQSPSETASLLIWESNSLGELTVFPLRIRRIFSSRKIRSRPTGENSWSLGPYDITIGSGPSASYGCYSWWTCPWPRSEANLNNATHLYSGVATLQPTVVSWCSCVWGKRISSVELRGTSSPWLRQKGKGWVPARCARLQFKL